MKVHWTPRPTLSYAACGASPAVPLTMNLSGVTCKACRRTKAFAAAGEREVDAAFRKLEESEARFEQLFGPGALARNAERLKRTN